MTYTAVIFVVTLVSTLVISLVSPGAGECSKGLTFFNRNGSDTCSLVLCVTRKNVTPDRYEGVKERSRDHGYFEKEEFLEKSTSDLLYIPSTSRYLINSISIGLCLLATFLFAYYSI